MKAVLKSESGPTFTFFGIQPSSKFWILFHFFLSITDRIRFFDFTQFLCLNSIAIPSVWLQLQLLLQFISNSSPCEINQSPNSIQFNSFQSDSMYLIHFGSMFCAHRDLLPIILFCWLGSVIRKMNRRKTMSALPLQWWAVCRERLSWSFLLNPSEPSFPLTWPSLAMLHYSPLFNPKSIWHSGFIYGRSLPYVP